MAQATKYDAKVLHVRSDLVPEGFTSVEHCLVELGKDGWYYAGMIGKTFMVLHRQNVLELAPYTNSQNSYVKQTIKKTGR